MTDRGMDLPSPFAGRYEVLRELGRGASAVVVLARDRTEEREVALKVLSQDYISTLGVERFHREVRLARRLQHPYIVPVLEAGDWEGWPYLVMPVIAGTTLRHRLVTERQLQVDEAVRFTREIADALQHAHDQGVVHRDVKPENVLLSGGHACLADFGIARAVAPATGEVITTNGMMLGTPAYVSPEQAAGGEVDTRSDQYSLACVFYEMLAGIQPFVGATTESVVSQRLAHPPAPIRYLRPSVPEAVERVLARAMLVTPADRYPSAIAFADALRTALEHPENGAARPTVVPGPPRRRRVILGAGLVVLAVVVGVLVWRRGRAAGDPSTASYRLIAQPGVGTPVTAMRSYDRGRAAFDAGREDSAIARFAEAASADPTLALASLWQAQLLQWKVGGAGDADWKLAARLAMRNRASLSPRDAPHAVALVALGEGRYPDACRAFDQMVKADSTSFAGWFGLGECRRLDRAVIRDPRSPAKWRFRAELSEAIRAYTEALALAPGEQVAPAIGRALSVFFGTPGRIRDGRAVPPDTGRFVSHPAYVHDSIAFVPVPVERAASPDMAVIPRDRALALQQVQEQQLAFVRSWVQRMPRSVDAHAGYAQALEVRGAIADDDPNAADALTVVRSARGLTINPRAKISLLAIEVRLLLKSGRFGEAGALADTVMGAEVARDGQAAALASLAVLQGREVLAARHLEALWLGEDRGRGDFAL